MTERTIKVVYLGLWELPTPFDKSKPLQDLFQEAHEWVNWTMAAIVVLHILAAFKHHLVDRDGTLRRMLPFQRRSSLCRMRRCCAGH